ncbi:hypothetical protein JTE90_012890 [Oedothorax gibbosus]|uniref:Endonuclease/exonuclease/phosphatase domain-containing protein n=1 Tax=Oedothorax gibbosus TaxID=931172 RepID=A0AAV6TLQ7_9ARAC|nr:hypothetical protein JTE90_012890 [Oedothorax gibbosus]
MSNDKGSVSVAGLTLGDILILSVYRSPKSMLSTLHHSLIKAVRNHTQIFTRVLIGGDFNCNLLIDEENEIIEIIEDMRLKAFAELLVFFSTIVQCCKSCTLENILHDKIIEHFLPLHSGQAAALTMPSKASSKAKIFLKP